MNWQKISTIISIITALVGSIWWVGGNVVLSAEFHSYQNQQQVRWLQMDKQSAWQQYLGLRQLKNKTIRDESRLLELERDIKDYNAEIESLRK